MGTLSRFGRSLVVVGAVAWLGAGCASGESATSDESDDDGGGASSSTGGMGGTSGTGGTGGGDDGCSETEELCDGLDDNCDGLVDEGCSCSEGDTQTCWTGPAGSENVGACESGTQTCTAEGTWGPCEGEVLPASMETCNGVDDDCNGEVDDGFETTTCGVGACEVTVSDCEMGMETTCTPGSPTTESCNGIDDDCDGQTDENNPGGGGSCTTGLDGVCSAGTLVCDSQVGSHVCVQDQMASSETCDGKDNDCDGQIDENNPEGGASCTTGLPGVCSSGTMTCTNGSLSCVQDTQASAEQCSDGLDNDCDGDTDSQDSDCGCSHALCTTGSALVDGCNQCVTDICNVDSYCCTNQWDSICVGEVESVCGSLTCPESAGSCPHPLCETGPSSTPFSSGCDQYDADCVTQICNADPYCCNTDWDSLCVNQVSSVCGNNCTWK